MTYAATVPPDPADVGAVATSADPAVAEAVAAAGAAMLIGWSAALASGLTSLTAPAQPAVGYPATPQTRPFSVRTSPAAASTAALVASVATTAHRALGAGGLALSAASAGRPKSTTRPTRFLPATAGVVAQSCSKVSTARGYRVDASSATAKRQPSTLPSLGTVWSGPF